MLQSSFESYQISTVGFWFMVLKGVTENDGFILEREPEMWYYI